MNYLPKSIALILLYLVLSAMKSWTFILLVFFALPVFTLWLIVLGVSGRKNVVLRNDILRKTGLSALALAFSAPGTADTEEVTVFTFIQTSEDSLVTSIALIFCLIAIIAFFVYAFKGLSALKSSKNIGN